MKNTEELAALRAELAEVRRQLDQVRSAFRFHDGKLVELCLRQARVQYLNFGPADDPDVTYGWIHSHENGTMLALADGEDHSAFSVSTGKRARGYGVEVKIRNDTTELALRPGLVAADVYRDTEDRREILAEVNLGICQGIATVGLFGPGKDALVTLRALADGGVVRCLSAADKSNVFIHARAGSPMVILDDEKGRQIAQMTSSTTGGALMLHGGEKGAPVVTLGSGEGGAFGEWRSFDGEPRVVIQAAAESSDVFIRRPGNARDGWFMQATRQGSTLDLVQESKRLAHLGWQELGMDVVLATAIGGGKFKTGPIGHGAALFLNTTDNRGLVFNPLDVKAQIASLSPDGLVQFQLGAPFDSGGRLVLHNEIGVERISISTEKDGGMIQLHQGGNLGVSMAATPQGGVLCTLDLEGVVTATLPADLDLGDAAASDEEHP